MHVYMYVCISVYMYIYVCIYFDRCDHTTIRRWNSLIVGYPMINLAPTRSYVTDRKGLTALPLAVSLYLTGLILCCPRLDSLYSFTIGSQLLWYWSDALLCTYLFFFSFFPFLSLFITFLRILWVLIKTDVCILPNIFSNPNFARLALSWLIKVPRLPRIIGTILVEAPCTLGFSLASGMYLVVFSSFYNNIFLSQDTENSTIFHSFPCRFIKITSGLLWSNLGTVSINLSHQISNQPSWLFCTLSLNSSNKFTKQFI